jgi:O-antigen/teichoic acid export membrane protein
MIGHLKQSTWAVLEYLVYPVLMFASTPFFLLHLGAQKYGLWMLLIALSGFGGLAGLGAGSATTKEVSHHRGAGTIDSVVGNIIPNSLSLALAGSIAVGLIYFLSWLFMPADWTARMGTHSEIQLLLVCSFLIISCEQVDSVFSGTIKGYERFDASAHTEIAIKCVSVLLYILTVIVSGSLLSLFVMAVIVAFLRAFFKGLVASSIAGSGLFSLQWDMSVIRELVSFGKWTWLQSFGAALFVAADRLIIGSYLGSEALARYSVFTQLTQQIHAIPSAATTVLFPIVSRKSSKNESIKEIVLGAIGIVFVIALTISAVLYFYGSDLLRLWLPSSFDIHDSSAFYFLIIAYGLLSLSVVPHFALLGMHKAKSVAICNLIAGIFSVVGCIYFINSENISAGAYSKIIYSLIVLVIYGFVFKKYIYQWKAS